MIDTAFGSPVDHLHLCMGGNLVLLFWMPEHHIGFEEEAPGPQGPGLHSLPEDAGAAFVLYPARYSLCLFEMCFLQLCLGSPPHGEQQLGDGKGALFLEASL